MAAVDSTVRVGSASTEVLPEPRLAISATGALFEPTGVPEATAARSPSQYRRNRGGSSLEDRFQDVVLHALHSGTLMSRWVTRRLRAKVIPAASTVTTRC